MEKAVLKTLIYADIFDYPLKINEIHKWLIGKKVTLRQIETAIGKLNYESYTPASQARIMSYGEYYFLKRKDQLVNKRLYREKQSEVYFRKAKILAYVLKMIPWIKLVGISGGLAMENASKKDDIDLFIITGNKRLWISRLFTLGLLSLTGQRRKRVGKIAGKLCVNILLEEDKLEQTNKDVYTAHELLQMKVLWQRDGIYSKYLADNDWAFKFLPNWISIVNPELGIMNYESRGKQKKHNSLFMLHDSAINILEGLAKKFQLKIMQKPRGLERIEDGALYFHPNDIREELLKRFNQSLTSSANVWYKF